MQGNKPTTRSVSDTILTTLFMRFSDHRHSITYLLNRFCYERKNFHNYSNRTIQSYKSSFGLLLRFAPVELISEISVELMEDFFYHGRSVRNWSSVTFHSYYKCYNVFYKWCVLKSVMDFNPMEKIPKPKLEQRLPRRLNLEDAEKVLTASYHMNYSFSFERYRNRAVVGCMLLAGLRRSEVINLRLQDVDLKSNVIYINQSKGMKDRLIPMNSRLIHYLEEYIKERKRLKRESIQFFTGMRNRPYGSEGIRHLFAKLRKATKLDFSAHTLRHSFATLMLEGGCDIYTLSQLMGHSRITTTTIYLQCTTKQRRKSIELHRLNGL